MSRLSASLFAVALAACAAPAAAELRVMARNPQGVSGDDPVWLDKLSRASGVAVRFAAAVSPRRASYRLACEGKACDTALKRLAASGLLEDISIEGRKRPPHPPASATLD